MNNDYCVCSWIYSIRRAGGSWDESEIGEIGERGPGWKNESGHQASNRIDRGHTRPSYQSGANHNFSCKTQVAPASG